MSTEVQYFVVDRSEAGIAVLIADSGETLEVPREKLPPDARSGSVLRVGKAPDGKWNWDSVILDEDERQRRLSRAKEILDELKKRDPGGDISL